MAPRVLIFDSGVGALSIAGELQSAAPAIELIVAMDRGGFPYGSWPEADLQQHICSLAKTLLDEFQPDIFVVACNTGSTTALPALRALTNTPVVGVVPAIKPAAALSNSRVIGLLATPGTVSRAYTDELIREHAADCAVLRVGSTELVLAVEDLFRNDTDNPRVWREVMAQFSKLDETQTMDTIVLACTHFPLVRDQLRAHTRSVSHWVDSGPAIARRVLSLLPAFNQSVKTSKHIAVQIGTEAITATLRARLAAMDICDIRQLPG